MANSAIDVQGVWKLYTRDESLAKRHSARAPAAGDDDPGPGRFWALKDVSFSVERGEVIGLIGANGAGESTLLKVISRVTAPTRGRIQVNGSLVSLLEVGTGFHDELSGRENIALNAAILGMAPADLKRRFDDIVEFSGIGDFIDMPVKHLSSGMRVRLGFSIAVHVAPDILIVDEVLSVGDAEFQEKCRRKVEELVRAHDRTVLIVSHSMASVDGLCSRAILMEDGQLTRTGEPTEVIDFYLDRARRRQAEAAAQAEAPGAAENAHAEAREAAEAAAIQAAQLKAAIRSEALSRKERERAAAELRELEKAQALALREEQEAKQAAFMRPAPLRPGVWDLARRVDRGGGSGFIQFESIALHGADGAPSFEVEAGRPAQFVLRYRAKPEVQGARKASFSIVILDERDEAIFWLPSSNAHSDTLEIAAEGAIVCALPELPLLPGIYRASIWVQVAGERADRINKAAEFTVAPSDYFPTGSLQKSDRHGRVLVRQTWSTQAPDNAASPRPLSAEQ